MAEHAQHRYRPAVPEDDGCLYSIHRCTCGSLSVKKKRRPAHVTDDECTWTISCADHPKMEARRLRAIARIAKAVVDSIPKDSLRQRKNILRAIARQLLIEATNLKEPANGEPNNQGNS